jgi:hypothetical protein
VCAFCCSTLPAVHATTLSRPFSFARLVTALCTAVLLGGCNMSDEAEELSGGYLYRNEGPDTKELLGDVFAFGKQGMESIHGRVVRYRHNAEFIVSVQHPVYEEYRTGLGFDLRCDLRKYPKNSETDIIASERVADSLLTHDPHYKAIFSHKINYWIIAHRHQKVYGPLTYTQYVQQARALQVPDRLMLEAEPQ